jgi:tetratricopeptide (TPR) repeat protein
VDAAAATDRVKEEWVPVSVSWEHAYGACRPEAVAVLRAVSVLDLRVVSSPAVGVAVELSPAETASSLAELMREGWTLPAGDGHTMVEQGRIWLARRGAGRPEEARAAAIIRRFAGYHAAAVDLEQHSPVEVGAWVRRHWPELLAGVRACDRDGLRRCGTGLAYAIWPAAGLAPDPQGWSELAEAGESLAIADRDPPMLADLLHRSAAAFAEQGDRLRAEAQWVRALAVFRREHGEVGRGAAILTGLAALYREWGRLGKALDADLSLVELRRSEGEPVRTAQALTEVATTMREAGRLRTAADYFGQADAELSPITGEDDAGPGPLSVHARILLWGGRTWWDLGESGRARRWWSRALAMMIDVDDDIADHVRALLATAPDHALPEDALLSTAPVGRTPAHPHPAEADHSVREGS